MSRETGVVSILLARDGKEQEVERILRVCAQHSMAEEGCLSYVLHRSVDQIERFVLVERWVSHVAIKQHRQMAHYKAMVNALLNVLIDRQVFVLEELTGDFPAVAEIDGRTL